MSQGFVNQLSTGGQTGQKVMVVGDGTKYIESTLSDGSAPTTNKEAIPIAGMNVSGNKTKIETKAANWTDATTNAMAVRVGGLPASAALTDTIGNPTTVMLGNSTMLYNGATWERFLAIRNATNSTGVGIGMVGLTGQFDDVAPTSITENQFGNLRMSANRNLYSTIRDAAGNERGANVNSSFQLSVSVDNSNVSTNIAQIAGATASTVASGVLKVGTADSTGSAFLSAANALNSTGSGLQAVQIIAQLDDTSPTTISENQFGNLRMSPERALLNGACTKQVTFTATSPNSASTVAQTAVSGLGSYRTFQLYTSLTGATGGVLDIYLQTTPDGGTTWVDWAHFTQLAAGGANVKKSFSFAKSGQSLTGTTVGTGTSPALAASTFIGGDWGEQIRVVFVAGASTSAGASQVMLACFST